jgi:hypothetical protein
VGASRVIFNQKMKAQLLTLLAFFSFCTTLFAQEMSAIPEKPMRVRLTTINRQVRNGYLYAFSDTSLLLSAERILPRLPDTLNLHGLRSFGYGELDAVQIYRKGGVGRSTLIGFGIGAGTGALIGLIGSGSSSGEMSPFFSPGQVAAAGAMVVGAAGAVVGLIVGLASQHNFYIGGQRKKYEQMRKQMIWRLGL